MSTKVHLVKAMVFPGVMYGCESWTRKKAECRRIDAFELWCWRRLLRIPWTARRSNQSIIKDISPGCSLEGLMLKLKLQYLGHLMRRADSFEKTLILGKIRAGGEGDNRGWDGWMVSPTQWYEFGSTLGVGDGQGGLECCGSWGRKESETTERLNWTEEINVFALHEWMSYKTLFIPVFVLVIVLYVESYGKVHLLSHIIVRCWSMTICILLSPSGICSLQGYFWKWNDRMRHMGS